MGLRTGEVVLSKLQCACLIKEQQTFHSDYILNFIMDDLFHQYGVLKCEDDGGVDNKQSSQYADIPKRETTTEVRWPPSVHGFGS